MLFFKRTHFFAIFFTLQVIAINSEYTEDLKVQYYDELISGMTEETESSQLPTSNKEFKSGLEAKEINDYGNFDFIIVGAGSAGAVLATRLSEVQSWKILLLEAGGEETDFSDIPAYALNLQYTRMNWGYMTVPQNNSCLGMKNKQCSAARGKVLGGTSVLNVMMYVRGNAEDFNNWEKLGNEGWSYEDVLPYFTKSENCDVDGAEAGFHGKGGLLNVEFDKPLSPMCERYFQANAELNQPQLDYNGKHQIGCSQTQFTTKRGRRHSTDHAFLDGARSRTNLNVTTNALATKILIDENKNATGVIFIKNNKKYKATAGKEVILSAGVINSPQLLMLSGIGPKEHLEEKNIKVIADLPVGKNLLEHPVFHGLKFSTNATGTNDELETQIKEYLQGYGPMTISTNVQAIAFSPSKKSKNRNVPAIEYMFYPFNITNELYNKAFNFNEDLVENYLNKLDQLHDIQIMPILLHEKSRGSLTLATDSPIDFPLIDFNMFSDKDNEDIAVMIESIEESMKLIDTKLFRAVNAQFIDDLPICKDKKKLSNQYWECLLRHMTSTIFHPCGTTKMGRKGEAVVDNNLKVYGIHKLRVVDAGVFPTTISGHPNAAVIMIAEKTADAIKKDYGKFKGTVCTVRKSFSAPNF